MKIRLVCDRHSAVEGWHLVQKWDDFQGRWALINCGLEPAMRKLFDTLAANGVEPQYQVIETTDTDTKDQFKAREAKADLSV